MFTTLQVFPQFNINLEQRQHNLQVFLQLVFMKLTYCPEEQKPLVPHTLQSGKSYFIANL